MMLPRNRIPSAELRNLFPGIDRNLSLDVSSHLFSFGATEMPVLHPHEQLVVAAIVRHTNPRRLVEFGTAQGQTTYVLAANSGAEAQVITLDLDPSRWTDYTKKCLRGDVEIGACYGRSPYAHKVCQLWRRTPRGMPEQLAAMRGAVDLILVDADHSYDAVRADTLTAVELASPRAVLLWHDFYMFPDYLREGPQSRGVFPYLNELHQEGLWVLRHIVGTYLVAGSRNWPKDAPGLVAQPGDTPAPFGEKIVRLAAAGGAHGS